MSLRGVPTSSPTLAGWRKGAARRSPHGPATGRQSKCPCAAAPVLSTGPPRRVPKRSDRIGLRVGKVRNGRGGGNRFPPRPALWQALWPELTRFLAINAASAAPLSTNQARERKTPPPEGSGESRFGGCRDQPRGSAISPLTVAKRRQQQHDGERKAGDDRHRLQRPKAAAQKQRDGHEPLEGAPEHALAAPARLPCRRR